jgi:hypothetical protein
MKEALTRTVGKASESGSGTSLSHQCLVACTFLIGSLSLQFSFPQIIGSDGFFHIRLANNPLTDMPWLPHSVFSDGWVDHQFLFHLLLAPFAWLLPGITAAKAAAATFAAVAGFICYRFLVIERCHSPLLYALLPAAVSWQFWLRMEMPRTQALSLALLVTAMSALSRGQHLRLFFLSWLYAWLYHVSVVLIPLALCHVAILALLAPGGKRRLPWMGVAASLGGLLSGFIIHPHSPRTLHYLYQHVVLKVLNREELPVGQEWLDGSLAGLLQHGWGGLVALSAALFLWILSRERRSGVTVLFGLCAAGASLAALQGTRFLEYSVPLSMLTLALALRDHQVSPPSFGWRPLRWCGAVLLGMLLLNSANTVRQAAQAEPDPQRLAAVMDFASTRIQAGETLFHFSWNDFPELVFHGPNYRYICGLDPHFLALQDASLWRLYQQISEGWGENPSKPIAQRFGARWALLVLPYEGAEELLGRDQGLHEEYRDENAILYRVSLGEEPRQTGP